MITVLFSFQILDLHSFFIKLCEMRIKPYFRISPNLYQNYNLILKKIELKK
jgi:hypothetical protein